MSIHGPAAINIKRLEERPELGPREAFTLVQTNELLKLDRARFVRIGEIKQGFVFCSLLRQPHVVHFTVVAIVLKQHSARSVLVHGFDPTLCVVVSAVPCNNEIADAGAMP